MSSGNHLHAEATPFTDGMWDGFQGAERFPNGDDPIFRIVDEQTLIVCDAHGVEIHLNGDKWPDEWEVGTMGIQFPNAMAAGIFINGISPPVTVRGMWALGFSTEVRSM